MASMTVLMRGLALACLGAAIGSAVPAQAQEARKPNQAAAFSFAAYGDSRPMMYLPQKDGKPDLVRLFVEMFGLVMPLRIAEAVVKKDVKLIYDPATNELVKVVMPFESKSEVMTLTVDKGWVTEASVEDVKLLPGVHRTMFRLQGGDWVAREIVKDVQAGRAEFVVNSGDVVWWGNQGRTVADSPYWRRVNDTMLKLLPPPDADMLAAGLEGRWFLGVGNHEVWGDPKIEGVLNAVPYLKKLGVTPENLIYKYDFKGARFIYLWSGKYDYRSPSLWDADRPKYAEQMRQLKQWLDEAKAQGIGKAFIVFHYPVFARSGLGPIPEPDNPHTADRVLRQGHGGHRLQRARPHHRDLRGRRREVPDAGRRRRRAGPDPARPHQHQGAGGLSAGSLLEGRAAQGGVQLRAGRRGTGAGDQVHAQPLPALVGRAVRDRAAVCRSIG